MSDDETLAGEKSMMSPDMSPQIYLKRNLH